MSSEPNSIGFGLCGEPNKNPTEQNFAKLGLLVPKMHAETCEVMIIKKSVTWLFSKETVVSAMTATKSSGEERYGNASPPQ